MAPNGSVSRKSTPVDLHSSNVFNLTTTSTAPAASATPKPTIKTEEGNNFALDDIFSDLENRTPNLSDNARKAAPAQLDQAGRWDSKKSAKPPPAHSHREGTPLTKIPSTLSKAFPNSRLMADRPLVMKCNHCKRPVLAHAMPGHIEKCLNKKQEKQRKKKEAKDARDAAARKEKGLDADDDEDGDEAVGKKTAGMTASKKRKAIDEGAEDAPSKKKKRKDEKTAGGGKAARPKAPVDVEKQCGVELPQGGQCARSLTCKSHSMGAKRAVPGRSAPYDKLLADYQRKNAAKIQKAQFEANAALDGDEGEDGEGGGAVLDEGEEMRTVLDAVGRNWGGSPLLRQPAVPLRYKYSQNRLKGILASAMSGPGGAAPSGFFGGGGGPSGFFTGFTATTNTNAASAEARAGSEAGTGSDRSSTGQVRRGSVILGARSMMAPSATTMSRKASVAAAS